MSDILILQERIKNSILVGESDFREFKSAWEGKPGNKKPRLTKHICADIAEGLVAFANTDGGELLVGIEDDLTLTGVPHSEEDIAAMLDAVRSHVFEGQFLPVVYALRVEIEGKNILFFQVDKGSEEVFQLRDGRVVIRKDMRTVPASVRRLQFDRQEIVSREFDRQWVDGAAVSDLDIVLINSTASQYLSRLSLTIEKFLQQVGLAEYTAGGLRLRMAALLLFAKDIQKWHPRCQVRIMRVAGTKLLAGTSYNVISDETVQGNILELVIAAWERLQPYIAQSNGLNVAGKFEPRLTYPSEACQEALVNAIFHRDYSTSNGIEIFFFDDRMEVKSPGALLSTLSVDDLYALDNRHDSRNVRIAQILKLTHSVRELGEGMKRIFTVMEANGFPKPRLHSNTNWFSIIFFKKPTI